MIQCWAHTVTQSEKLLVIYVIHKSMYVSIKYYLVNLTAGKTKELLYMGKTLSSASEIFNCLKRVQNRKRKQFTRAQHVFSLIAP